MEYCLLKEKKLPRTQCPWDEAFNSLVGVGVQVLAQGLDILLKGLYACRGDAAQRAWPLALECLLDSDVACRGEFVELNAQVARRCACLLLDEGKLGFLGSDEQRHHRQAQLTVQ